jgi:hypothetical protein
VRKAFYGAFEGTEIDFDEAVSSALTQIGLPEAFAKEPMAGIRHYLDGIAAASFSLSLDRAGLEEFGPRAARLAEIAKQLEAIQRSIRAYGAAAESGASSLPKDLTTLGLDAAAITDPWKHPYDYRIEKDGTFVVRSLGADGKPGGTGADADISTADIGKEAEGFLELLGFQTVIEFKNQTALGEMQATLTGLIAKSELKSARSGPFQMSGVQAELQSWKGPENELHGAELWLMRAQNMLVLGAGRSTPEAFAARLADPRVQTAAEQFYAGLLKDFGAPTGATIVQGSLHLADYAAAFRKFAETEGSDTEMLDMMDSMLPNASVRIQLVGERFVTEATTKYVKPKGLVAQALGLSPFSKGILTAVPEDAIGVYVTSIDGPLTWAAIKDSLAKGEDDTQTAQEQLTAVEERYGFSVEKDIFGSLGKGVLMYLLPLKGITSIPGMALVADLKDPVAMQRGIEGLMAMLGEEEGAEFKIRSKPYHDAPVWTFNFGQDESGGGMSMLMNNFSPSISIVKNRLLVTLNLMHMKKEIRRAFGEEQGAHLITTEGHRPPEDATAFAYMDWAVLLNGMYEGGRGLANLMGAAVPVPVDVAKLPQPGVFTHFYKPTIYYSRSIPNGVYYRNESSFGPEVWAGIIGAGLVGSVAVRSHSDLEDESSGKEDEMESDEEGPTTVPGKVATDVQHTQTTAELRHLATSIAVFQMDSGKYPANLDALLTPTKSYPDGFVGKKTLANDGWGHGFKYTLLDGAKRYRLWSMGPDGVDQEGAGDDLVSP